MKLKSYHIEACNRTHAGAIFVTDFKSGTHVLKFITYRENDSDSDYYNRNVVVMFEELESDGALHYKMAMKVFGVNILSMTTTARCKFIAALVRYHDAESVLTLRNAKEVRQFVKANLA